MKRIINLGLLIAFSFCYLEWPPNNSMFIFQGEYEIFTNTKNMASNFTHPIILLGLVTQLILLYSAIKVNVSKKLNHLGVLLLTPVVLLFLVVGILSSNIKIILSTLPFLGLVVYYFILQRRATHK